MTRVSFIVFGQAQPKGSTRAFMPKGARFPVVTSDNPNLKTWAQQVKHAAQNVRELDQAFIADAPVKLSLTFTLRRPLRLRTKAKRALLLHHTTKPDLDKLTRAVKDALTGVLWTDDSQVAQLDCSKLYANETDGPQCCITVEELAPVASLPLVFC